MRSTGIRHQTRGISDFGLGSSLDNTKYSLMLSLSGQRRTNSSDNHQEAIREVSVVLPTCDRKEPGIIVINSDHSSIVGYLSPAGSTTIRVSIVETDVHQSKKAEEKKEACYEEPQKNESND
ncbi:hypothetical protein PSTG_12997 [Puccinia striiformis f. sp. tritici PST-78]|uniref:Uncharacterized protein n=1 Tax=Puccinia striiformis f. sp. tritici PST-78 TaxID=1165861 RepID=A0A0L0V375_9BASI|nr:hypothetical protein PSTG_12997 [Puccinia striiformis f. sp. tritici PST-78]